MSRIAGGDTKVVEHGKADNMYITTTGVGRLLAGVEISPQSVLPGDKVLLSGPIGDHGITILLARGDLDLEAELQPTPGPSSRLLRRLCVTQAQGFAGCAIRPAEEWRHPSTNWRATPARVSSLFEEKIPVRDSVRGACELLGLDPLHIANEGQFLAIVSSEHADAALQALHSKWPPEGEEAVVIGLEVRAQPESAVLVTTLYGGRRHVDMLVGDPLPRICKARIC